MDSDTELPQLVLVDCTGSDGGLRECWIGHRSYFISEESRCC